MGTWGQEQGISECVGETKTKGKTERTLSGTAPRDTTNYTAAPGSSQLCLSPGLSHSFSLGHLLPGRKGPVHTLQALHKWPPSLEQWFQAAPGARG